MNIKQAITNSIIMLVMSLSLFHFAQADNDHIEARQLYNAGEILSLEAILKKVRLTYPGRILEVELEKEDGLIVYELEILGEDGIIREVDIDAKTGKLLAEKEDD